MGDDGRASEITLAMISAEDEGPYFGENFGENCILAGQVNSDQSKAGASVSTRVKSHLLVVYRDTAADFLRSAALYPNLAPSFMSARR